MLMEGFYEDRRTDHSRGHVRTNGRIQAHAAGQRMQLSYSSCWNIIRTLESQVNYPLIERSQGGAGGSTSVLTLRGKELLLRYNAYEKALKERANELYERYFGGLLE